jgi:glutaredoxin 3
MVHHFIFMTATIEIYTKFGCPFCVRAKHLLDTKGAAYQEYDVTMGGATREEMLARAPGARTVPQIFINNVAIGGSDELRALESEGKLSNMLSETGD